MKLPREAIGQNPPPHARQSYAMNGYYNQEFVLVQPTSNHNGNNSRGTYGWEEAQNYQNGNIHQYPPQPHQEPAPLPQNDSNPFAEYAWMVDADEFDKQMMEEMEQQDYFENCFEQMWLEEEENEGECYLPQQEAANHAPIQSIQPESMEKLTLEERPQTRLNPNAAEFVPRSAMVHH